MCFLKNPKSFYIYISDLHITYILLFFYDDSIELINSNHLSRCIMVKTPQFFLSNSANITNFHSLLTPPITSIILQKKLPLEAFKLNVITTISKSKQVLTLYEKEIVAPTGTVILPRIFFSSNRNKIRSVFKKYPYFSFTYQTKHMLSLNNHYFQLYCILTKALISNKINNYYSIFTLPIWSKYKYLSISKKETTSNNVTRDWIWSKSNPSENNFNYELSYSKQTIPNNFTRDWIWSKSNPSENDFNYELTISTPTNQIIKNNIHKILKTKKTLIKTIIFLDHKKKKRLNLKFTINTNQILSGQVTTNTAIGGYTIVLNKEIINNLKTANILSEYKAIPLGMQDFYNNIEPHTEDIDDFTGENNFEANYFNYLTLEDYDELDFLSESGLHTLNPQSITRLITKSFYAFFSSIDNPPTVLDIRHTSYYPRIRIDTRREFFNNINYEYIDPDEVDSYITEYATDAFFIEKNSPIDRLFTYFTNIKNNNNTSPLQETKTTLNNPNITLHFNDFFELEAVQHNNQSFFLNNPVKQKKHNQYPFNQKGNLFFLLLEKIFNLPYFNIKDNQYETSNFIPQILKNIENNRKNYNKNPADLSNTILNPLYTLSLSETIINYIYNIFTEIAIEVYPQTINSEKNDWFLDKLNIVDIYSTNNSYYPQPRNQNFKKLTDLINIAHLINFGSNQNNTFDYNFFNFTNNQNSNIISNKKHTTQLFKKKTIFSKKDTYEDYIPEKPEESPLVKLLAEYAIYYVYRYFAQNYQVPVEVIKPTKDFPLLELLFFCIGKKYVPDKPVLFPDFSKLYPLNTITLFKLFKSLKLFKFLNKNKTLNIKNIEFIQDFSHHFDNFFNEIADVYENLDPIFNFDLDDPEISMLETLTDNFNEKIEREIEPEFLETLFDDEGELIGDLYELDEDGDDPEAYYTENDFDEKDAFFEDFEFTYPDLFDLLFLPEDYVNFKKNDNNIFGIDPSFSDPDKLRISEFFEENISENLDEINDHVYNQGIDFGPLYQFAKFLNMGRPKQDQQPFIEIDPKFPDETDEDFPLIDDLEFNVDDFLFINTFSEIEQKNFINVDFVDDDDFTVSEAEFEDTVIGEEDEDEEEIPVTEIPFIERFDIDLIGYTDENDFKQSLQTKHLTLEDFDITNLSQATIQNLKSSFKDNIPYYLHKSKTLDSLKKYDYTYLGLYLHNPNENYYLTQIPILFLNLAKTNQFSKTNNSFNINTTLKLNPNFTFFFNISKIYKKPQINNKQQSKNFTPNQLDTFLFTKEIHQISFFLLNKIYKDVWYFTTITDFFLKKPSNFYMDTAKYLENKFQKLQRTIIQFIGRPFGTLLHNNPFLFDLIQYIPLNTYLNVQKNRKLYSRNLENNFHKKSLPLKKSTTNRFSLQNRFINLHNIFKKRTHTLASDAATNNLEFEETVDIYENILVNSSILSFLQKKIKKFGPKSSHIRKKQANFSYITDDFSPFFSQKFIKQNFQNLIETLFLNDLPLAKTPNFTNYINIEPRNKPTNNQKRRYLYYNKKHKLPSITLKDEMFKQAHKIILAQEFGFVYYDPLYKIFGTHSNFDTVYLSDKNNKDTSFSSHLNSNDNINLNYISTINEKPSIISSKKESNSISTNNTVFSNNISSGNSKNFIYKNIETNAYPENLDLYLENFGSVLGRILYFEYNQRISTNLKKSLSFLTQNNLNWITSSTLTGNSNFKNNFFFLPLNRTRWSGYFLDHSDYFLDKNTFAIKDDIIDPSDNEPYYFEEKEIPKDQQYFVNDPFLKTYYDYYNLMWGRTSFQSFQNNDSISLNNFENFVIRATSNFFITNLTDVTINILKKHSPAFNILTEPSFFFPPNNSSIFQQILEQKINTNLSRILSTKILTRSLYNEETIFSDHYKSTVISQKTKNKKQNFISFLFFEKNKNFVLLSKQIFIKKDVLYTPQYLPYYNHFFPILKKDPVIPTTFLNILNLKSNSNFNSLQYLQQISLKDSNQTLPQFLGANDFFYLYYKNLTNNQLSLPVLNNNIQDLIKNHNQKILPWFLLKEHFPSTTSLKFINNSFLPFQNIKNLPRTSEKLIYNNWGDFRSSDFRYILKNLQLFSKKKLNIEGSSDLYSIPNMLFHFFRKNKPNELLHEKIQQPKNWVYVVFSKLKNKDKYKNIMKNFFGYTQKFSQEKGSSPFYDKAVSSKLKKFTNDEFWLFNKSWSTFSNFLKNFFIDLPYKMPVYLFIYIREVIPVILLFFKFIFFILLFIFLIYFFVTKTEIVLFPERYKSFVLRDYFRWSFFFKFKKKKIPHFQKKKRYPRLTFAVRNRFYIRLFLKRRPMFLLKPHIRKL